MTPADIAHVRTFIFDLDNTLYAPETGLMDRMNHQMTEYLQQLMSLSVEEAVEMRHRYWKSHGTTLNGLMQEHGIDPLPFMEHVHKVDLSPLSPCIQTRTRLQALDGRRIIFTNADKAHADRVLHRLGLADLFAEIYDVSRCGWRPKPYREPYELILRDLGEDPAACLMVEDHAPNLEPAHALGMTTVLIAPQPSVAAYVHHTASTLTTWLEGVTP
jgi:putative hydrolase of the HAD superfamily